MKITQQMQKDFNKARHVGVMKFSFYSNNKRGLSAEGINLNLYNRMKGYAEKCGAEVYPIVTESKGDGNTVDIMVLEITDPLASYIEKCKGSN